MKIEFDFNLRTLLYNKKFTVTFSVVIAFIIWMVVFINQTSSIERTITNIPVTITTSGTAVGEMGLDEISGASQQRVTIKVSGPAYIVSNLEKDDIVVSPSLSAVNGPGTYQLNLSVTKLNFNDEYSVVNITPSNLIMSFDYIDTKQFTVIPKVTGVSAVAGLVAEDPVISNINESVVTVKGPRAEVEKIDSIEARVKTTDVLGESKSYDAEFTLLDSEGVELDKSAYTLSAEKATVTVPISRVRVLPVTIKFANAPENYGSFIKYNVSHSELTVIGPAATVDALTSVELQEIDFYNISKSANSFEVAPELPNGVRILDNTETVTVKIDTSSMVEKTFTVTAVNHINNTQGFNVSLVNPLKNVKLCGPRSVINGIKAENLYVLVDLTGKTAGDYTVSVAIKSTKNNNFWQVGSYQASISIK